MLLRLIEFGLLYLIFYPVGSYLVEQLRLDPFKSMLGRIVVGVLSFATLSLLFSFFIPPWKILIFLFGASILMSFYKGYWRLNISQPIAMVSVILFAAFFTIGGYIPDEGGYYGQTLEIFQRFGLIKGVANFDFRLGFSSGFHGLQYSL